MTALAGVNAQGVGQADYIPQGRQCRVEQRQPAGVAAGAAGSLETGKPDSQNGQMMWSSLDAVGDRTLIAASFAARLQTYRPAGWRDIHRKVDRGVEIKPCSQSPNPSDLVEAN
jgi:hypothetical protein